MNKKRVFFLMMGLWASSYFVGCKTPDEVSPTGSSSDDEAESTAVHEAANDYTWNSADVVPITLNGNTVSVGGSGATASGSTVTINSGGTYSLSGKLTNGQVIVNSAGDATVRLILNGVDISNSRNSPIYIKDAGKVVIALADNTTNKLTDALSYTYDDVAEQEPDAALFSKSDLTIFGNGSLTVNGQFADGIASKDGLIIKSGNLTVNAADDGIRGRDYLIVKGGTMTINAKADGLKGSNDEDAALGYVLIEDGVMNITCGDDGVHAESKLDINKGTITIARSYEGLESKVITINDGTIHVVSTDDGINVAGGNDASGGNAGPGQSSSSSANYMLNINGGYIVVDAAGDGLDANGSITMTGGIVLVNGPTTSGNGALDYDRSFKITGGTLLAVGSSGMAQAPDATSTQNSVLVGFTAAQAAGTLVRIQSSDGKTLVSFKPTKRYQLLAFSSPALTRGTSYDVYSGGSATGTATDGLYQDGTFTAGTKYTTFTVSSVVTRVNAR